MFSQAEEWVRIGVEWLCLIVESIGAAIIAIGVLVALRGLLSHLRALGPKSLQIWKTLEVAFSVAGPKKNQ